MRFFKSALLAAFICLPCFVTSSFAARAQAPTPGKYYIALGDSFSAGYLTPKLPIDTQCVAPDAPGFTCIFWRYLRQQNPQLRFQNFSQPGADSCQLVQGHRCYESTPRETHLDAAVAFITAHPGQVSPITVTIGGNDVLALVPAALANPSATVARLPAVFRTYRANLDIILSRLRAAAPAARIIVTTQPNSLGGIPSSFLPTGLSAVAGTAIADLNAVMRQEAVKYGVVVADSAGAFARNPGGAYLLTYLPEVLTSGDPSQANIHPTPNGYKVYAMQVIRDSGYLRAISVSARLATTTPIHGRSDKVKGHASAGTSLAIHIVLPGGHVRNITTLTPASGSYAAKFKVGRHVGPAHLRVCATDVFGQRACSSRLLFVVR